MRPASNALFTMVLFLTVLQGCSGAIRNLSVQTIVANCEQQLQRDRLVKIHQKFSKDVSIQQTSPNECVVTYTVGRVGTLDRLNRALLLEEKTRFSLRDASALLYIDGAAISGRAKVTVTGRLSPPRGTVLISGESYPIMEDGSFEVELTSYEGDDWIPAEHKLIIGVEAICIPLDNRNSICHSKSCPGTFSGFFVNWFTDC